MADCAGNIWPISSISGGCILGKLSVDSGEEITQCFRFSHTAVGHDSRRAMAGDAILSVIAMEHLIRHLASALLRQFTSHVRLSVRMRASCPLGIDVSMAGLAVQLGNYC
jgi:hypothetical protein